MTKIKIFKKSEAVAREISESYVIYNFLAADDCKNVSIAVGNAENHNETTKTTSDRAYYVFEGEIIIDDNIVGINGDVIFIPSNTEYNFKGTFKAVIVNSPAFNSKNEKIRENKVL